MSTIRPRRGTVCVRRWILTAFWSAITAVAAFPSSAVAQAPRAQTAMGIPVESGSASGRLASSVEASHRVSIVIPSFASLSNGPYEVETYRGPASSVRLRSNNPRLRAVRSVTPFGVAVAVAEPDRRQASAAPTRYAAGSVRTIVVSGDTAADTVYVTIVE